MKPSSLSQVASAAAFIALPLLLPGCSKPVASTGVPLAQQPDSVILLRGVAGGVFSKGMDELASRLQREGHPTVVTSHMNWMSVADARSESGRPVKAIIGHSAGADAAIEVARSLNRRGVDVGYLFLFDPRFPLTIPPNVRQCYNFMSPVPVGHSVPVLPDLGNTRTLITNEVKWKLGHLNIDDNLDLQNFIVSRLGTSDRTGRSSVRFTKDLYPRSRHSGPR